MRRVIAFRATDVLPSDSDVLYRLDTPSAGVTGSTRALLDEAAVRIKRRAEPRGVIQEIAPEDFARVYRGEGDNVSPAPLEFIYPRADSLALFVATIGAEAGEEIASLFKDDDPALAIVLDAYASESTNRLAYLLASAFSSEGGERGAAARVLPYSPGYCGWHVSGQRALFNSVEPGDIGVSLSSSCMMSPVKSVSGVLVAGDAGAHRFRPIYGFCDECATHDCVPRIASVSR